MADITEQELTLTLQAFSSAPEEAKLGEPHGGLGVSRALWNAGSVSFEACRPRVAPLTLEPRGYELAGDPAPSETITTAVSEFCALRVNLEPADDLDASLYVTATHDDDALTFSSDTQASLVFETDADHPFGSQPLLLGVDLAIWLAGLPAEDDDATAQRLEAQLYDAAALYVDQNGNGALDADERTPILQGQP